MCCGYQKWQKGVRTFSNFVPAYAQGAYFPGDEPGYICAKTGETCGDPDGDTPEDCHLQEDTGWFCPRCAEDDEKVPLRRNACGIVTCEYGHKFGDCNEAPPMPEKEECEA